MKLNKNKKGSIEGLPLQLMIVIIIATMGTAILLGWMGNIDTPNSIDTVDIVPGQITLNGNTMTNDATVDIYVADQDGNPIANALVSLNGLGVMYSDGSTAYAITDSTGNAHFDNLHITLRGSNVGFISVEVNQSDYGSNNSARIAVIS